jgi:hypothetical protein
MRRCLSVGYISFQGRFRPWLYTPARMNPCAHAPIRGTWLFRTNELTELFEFDQMTQKLPKSIFDIQHKSINLRTSWTRI